MIFGHRWMVSARCLLEAVSWVGLLVGMYFKYLASAPTEIGVKVFGIAHGLIFMAFVVAACWPESRSNGRSARGCWR